MALYIPAGRRRRRLLVAAGAALVIGLLVGGLIGRSTAPGIEDRVASVRSRARATAAGLRVVVLHDEAGAAATGATGSGTDLVLSRTRSELQHELSDAIWLPSAQGAPLVAELDALAGRNDKTSAAFGAAAEALAQHIESAFGT